MKKAEKGALVGFGLLAFYLLFLGGKEKIKDGGVVVSPPVVPGPVKQVYTFGGVDIGLSGSNINDILQGTGL